MIGAGGMGRVYLAHDTKHDRDVAIKVLDPDSARMVGTHRFMREIQIAAKLTHPNIVQLYDSGEAGGQLFYVMPYVEGESLRQRLLRETMLPVGDAVRWAVEICDGLAYAHAHDIVHRDIKPENLLFQGDHLLIADFGIARAMHLAAEEMITSEQLVLGTPIYMSPEQATGTAIDGRSDLYSLGCVVHEMLTGEPPYRGATPQAVTAKKLAGQYPGVRIVRPTVPQALEHTIARALAVIPADRFPSVEEFAQSLRSAARPRRGRVLLRLLALAVVSGALVLAVARYPVRSEPAPPPRPRVVVQLFDNRTGDSRFDPLGFMATDWVTEGLQRTAAVDVVPSPTALAASRLLRDSAAGDPVRELARETGATLVVSGAIYRDQDTLVFQAQLANAVAHRLVGVVEPIRTGQAQPAQALQQLRARLMGLLSLSMDDRAIQAERPPTYAAYQAFSEGMDAYIRNDDRLALAAFEKAHALDTTFVLALLYAAFCHTNLHHYAPADSVLRLAAPQRDRLNQHDRYWLEYQMAELAGNTAGAVAAIRRAAELAPGSKAVYNFAVATFEGRQPFAAESALQRLSPDLGSMRGWLPYWDQIASALHVEGKHRQELTAAREARRRFPDRIDAYLPEARALGAERKSAELEKLWLSATANTKAEPAQLGTLAYEAGSELLAHGDSGRAQVWLKRAYQEFTLADTAPGATEARWGRMQAAARLGRLNEAFELGQALIRDDPARNDFTLGLLGIVAARLGNRTRAKAVLEQLAADRRPYTFAEPQFQAGRIAAELGDYDRADELLAFASASGYPYDMEFHRDQSLARLRGRPIFGQLDVRH
jgi:serine/threonine-protein kinase